MSCLSEPTPYIGDGAEHAERCNPDNQPHGPEQDDRRLIDEGCNLLRLVADQRQADAEDDREEQHLQHVVACQGIERGGGDDVEQEAANTPAFELGRVVCVRAHGLGVEGRRIDVHAVAGRECKRENQANHQRHGRHAFEINERLDANPPDLLEIARAGDAMHHDAEHDRRDDHGDELQKRIAEDLQADREVRRGDTEDDPQEQGHQDLHEQ
jgi:hypothetical protein